MSETRVAWVTGASGGIGRALSLRLAGQGWQVAASARGEEKLRDLAMEADGRVQVHPLDVTDAAASEATVAAIEQQHGPIELAVLNAGDYRPMPADAFDAELCQRLMAVNYLGVVHGLAALLPRMRARGRGEILIMASVAGYRGLPLAAPYGATKAALISLAESLRAELGRSGVVIRVVNPGFVRTDLTAQNAFRMPALMPVEDAAEAIVAAIGGRGFEITFPRRFTYVLKLLRMLPYALYFPLIRRMTGQG
ncbi:MAG: SDR family NAD(P)-dependent oxidoreductase [Gammaproteobacteria bacterium]|nr:SDR family NAD(P)-dependent oxidoreductase [Gammaproteobacteria bacterium]